MGGGGKVKNGTVTGKGPKAGRSQSWGGTNLHGKGKNRGKKNGGGKKKRRQRGREVRARDLVKKGQAQKVVSQREGKKGRGGSQEGTGKHCGSFSM